MKEKVFVAMSGGVDSSLSAMLLKEQGYEVVGVTMQVWPQPSDETKACCSLDAVEDARRVAANLDIPHYVLNYRELFQATVIDYFCHDYIAGRTPNPCVVCNRYIKFDNLLMQILSMGGDKLATGHYARINNRGDDKGPLALLKGVEPAKDQSYFLCYMNQFQLAHVLFPLGEYSKGQVREMARDRGLLVADKPDSQEICFINGSYHNFVEDYMHLQPCSGDFRLLNGQVVGKHQGIHRYTVGQRRGLNLPLGYPAYVVKLDVSNNIVWIGEDSDLWSRDMLVEDFNYISGEPFDQVLDVKVKIRSAARAEAAQAIPVDHGKLKIEFQNPQRAITPGQTAVLYAGDEVIGGGRIADRTD